MNDIFCRVSGLVQQVHRVRRFAPGTPSAPYMQALCAQIVHI